MDKALIVDDSKLIRRNIRAELEKLNYQVFEAADYSEAKQKLSESYYEIVTLDIVLPDGNGLELCKEIKNNPAFDKTVVMMITSSDLEEIRLKSLKNGAFGFFQKNAVRGNLAVFLKNITEFIKKCSFIGLKALVVEDSSLQRNFVCGLLKRIDIEPTGLESIHSAVKLIKSGYSPDIILIDYFFGVSTTSTEFVHFMRNEYANKKIPIIVMTVAEDREIRNKLFYAGVNDFFRKPFDVEEFYLRIRAHLINKILLDDMEKKQKQLQLQAITDGLTGIYNRRFFYEALQQEENRYKRKKLVYSIVMFDIDNFKQINDKYGHATGDEVIKDMASMATKLTRDSDIVARYGGEEFTILLPETDSCGAFVLAEKLRELIMSNSFPKLPQTVTASFGVASADEADTFEQVIQLADERLYQAKRLGKNQTVGS